MIATGDIKDILMNRIKEHPILGSLDELVKDSGRPVRQEEYCEEIVVTAGDANNDPLQLTECQIKVYVPDQKIYDGPGPGYLVPDHERLTELENECIDLFRDETSGIFAGYHYTYKLAKIKQEAEEDTWSHFIQADLIFEVINI